MSWIVNKAETIGATAFQIFMRNNRNFQRRAITRNEMEDFNSSLLNSSIKAVVVHAPYTMNPCSDENDKRSKAIRIISEDLQTLSQIAGNVFYVLHPGSAKDLTTKEALQNLREVLLSVQDYIGNTTLCLEYMAGAGTQMLCTPEQIEYTAMLCYDIPNLKFCFDTCHVFASGYDIKETFLRLKQYVGVVHLNNSVGIKNSHVDRHAPLNYGSMSFAEILDFMHCVEDTTPVILETPKESLLEGLYMLQELGF